MNKSRRNYVLNILRETIAEYFKESAHFHAATVSYYTLFSLIPLMYLAVALFGYVFGEVFCVNAITDFFSTYIGLKDITMFTEYFKSINQHSNNWLLNFIMTLLLLYSCSAFMLALKHSLNDFFDVEIKLVKKKSKILKKLKVRLISLFQLTGIALIVFIFYFVQLFLINVLSSWISSTNSDFFVLHIFSPFLLNLILSVLMFKFLQDGELNWRCAIWGAAVTSLLLLVSQLLIKWYLQNYFMLGKSDIIGSVFILMAWVFYSVQVIFFGAKFTYIYHKFSKINS